jgi:hypothetical protein
MLKTPQLPSKLPGSFWGVTNFFNPGGYANKYENYRIFRQSSKRQGLNLVAVELAFNNDPFVLKKDVDAEILIQLRGVREKNLMWQGERLFNLGIASLPDDCDKLCWADCDILFKNERWIKETSCFLEQYMVVQPYEQVVRLPKGVCDLNENEFKLFAIGNEEAQRCPGYVYKFVHNLKGFDSTGFVWAARRSFVDSHPLYEHMLFGGGDSIMARSFISDKIPEVPIRLFSTDSMRADQDAYASRVYRDTQGSVYYIQGSILHLWHGNEADKLKFFRHKLLKFFSFSPVEDSRVGSNGFLEWSSDKPEFHKAVGEYYQIRNEEGGGSFIVSQVIDELNTVNKKLKAAELRLKNIEADKWYRSLFKKIRSFMTKIFIK